MPLPRISLLFLIALCAGCKQVDGVYYPRCAAFEGDKLVLREGTVVWDRFTDQIIIDADGNEIDKFPEFPKAGRYTLDGDLLQLSFDDGKVTKTLHVRRSGERILLLNDENLAEFQQTGRHSECVLALAPDEAS